MKNYPNRILATAMLLLCLGNKSCPEECEQIEPPLKEFLRAKENLAYETSNQTIINYHFKRCVFLVTVRNSDVVCRKNAPDELKEEFADQSQRIDIKLPRSAVHCCETVPINFYRECVNTYGPYPSETP